MSKEKLIREKCLGGIPWGEIFREGIIVQRKQLVSRELFRGNCPGTKNPGVIVLEGIL